MEVQSKSLTPVYSKFLFVFLFFEPVFATLALWANF